MQSVGVGVRRWFARRRSDDDRPLDGDAMVDLEIADHMRGPLIVAALEQRGIHAETVDAFDPVSAITRARILVRRSELEAASEAMTEIR
jgi:hypothetical protein